MSWYTPRSCNCNCGDIVKPVCEDVFGSFEFVFDAFFPFSRLRYTAGHTAFGAVDVLLFVNGTLDASHLNVPSVNQTKAGLSFGDVVRMEIRLAGSTQCETVRECTWYGDTIDPTLGVSCVVYDASIGTYLDENGNCIKGPQNADHTREPTSHQATISGLTGPMADLNGTYTVSCNGGASAEVKWGTAANLQPSYGSIYPFNCGHVNVQWLGDNHASALIASSHGYFDGSGNVVCGSLGIDVDVYTSQFSTKSPITETRTGVQRQRISCEDCSGDTDISWTTGSTDLFIPNSGACDDLGACAYPGTIVWNY